MINNYENNTNPEGEITRMKELMGYGLNESKSNSGNSNVAFHQVGPDGNTYAIVNEGKKFYIKVAPKKDTEILAEDYDYIGGYMNKKEYEYPTYTIASKQFGLKMKSLNEAYATKEKKNKVMLDKPIEPAEWQVNETKEMRQEINRFNQLMNNVDYILSEGKELDGKALQLGNKDVDEEGGNAYQEKPTPESKVNNMKENAPAPKDSDDTYSEKPMTTDQINKIKENSKDPRKADSTYSKPAPKTVKLTEEQAKVLGWNDDMDYIDTKHGTEIGDSAPYDDRVEKVYEVVYNSEDMNQHTGDAERFMEPFDNKVNEEVEIDAETGLPDEEPAGQMLVDDEEIPTDYYVDFETRDDMDDFEPVEGEIVDEFDTDMLPDEVLDYETRDDMDAVLESVVNKVMRKILNESENSELEDYAYKNCGKVPYNEFWKLCQKNGVKDEGAIHNMWQNAVASKRNKDKNRIPGGYKQTKVNENKLDVFGKHPAYQKQPMTTPPNTEPSKFGKEWDDDSVKGEKPYGSEILHGGDPYTERVIDMLTDSVVDRLISSMTNESSKKKV